MSLPVLAKLLQSRKSLLLAMRHARRWRHLAVAAFIAGYAWHAMAANSSRSDPVVGKSGVTRATPGISLVLPQVAAGRSHSLVITREGQLWGWGSNAEGQLGLGNDEELRAIGVTQSSQYPPTAIGTGFAYVAAGNTHTLAIKKDGSLWAWGSNTYGQLGDGSTSHRYRPNLIGQGFAKAAAGFSHSAAIKSDGSLWTWGANGSGQLGDGTRESRNRPVKIGDGYVAVAVGVSHTIGLRTDGSLWAWGANAHGQHGDNTLIGFDDAAQRTLPVQVGDEFIALDASSLFSVTIKADGSLWAWGDNLHGRVGDGTTESRKVPTRIGEGFRQVAASSHVLAVKNDGTGWAWGYNSDGQLGIGTIQSSSIPVKIGKDFYSLAAGAYHSLALKTDQTIWAWGANRDGQVTMENIEESVTVPVKVTLPIQDAGPLRHRNRRKNGGVN